MARTITNISMPGTMRLFVENRVEQSGYASISEYLRELIRKDQRLELEQFDDDVGHSTPRIWAQNSDFRPRSPLKLGCLT